MSTKVAFVTSSHSPFDDRIFYHQAKSLVEQNFNVQIICSTKEICTKENSIFLNGFNDSSISKKNKIKEFAERLKVFNPDITICSEPLPILASASFKKHFNKDVKIIYDVTEWYPSKKNLRDVSGINKITVFIKLLFINLYATCFVDGFLFGEHYKSIPYKFLFPLKKNIFIGYYPSLNYINYTESKLQESSICLGYTGTLSEEKGILNFLRVLKNFNLNYKEIKVKAKIIGKFLSKEEKDKFDHIANELSEIEFEMIDFVEFERFSDHLQEINIFFDLRKTDFENQHCLPIKLFFYAACARPVIYSKLKAITKEVDVSSFGYTVNPTDYNGISEIINNYIIHPFTYYEHCINARSLAKNKYNWNLIEPLFIGFINTFLK